MKRLAPALVILLSACTSAVPISDVTDRSTYRKDLSSAVSRNDMTVLKLGSLKEVNDYVNRHVRYVSDRDNHWQSLDETMRRGAGDCEDYAIAKRQLVLQNNLAKPSDVHMLLVWDRFKNVPHAVLFVNGQILDNQVKKIDHVKGIDFMTRYKVLGTARTGP